MTTIKDVAKHARVSVTSASYALNGNGTISDETRRRVLRSAEELNYHPNAFARNLKHRNTLTIGVFITRFAGSFYEEILEGIHQVILQTDYELIVIPETHGKRRILSHRQVDGAIVFDVKVPNETLLKLASQKFPIVVLDRDLENEWVHPLLIDNRGGAAAAFEHLYGQGMRRIAFVSGPMDSYDSRERMKAFLAEGDRAGLEIPCYPGNFTEVSGYEAALAVFAAGELPEAVFCANDQMAIGFLKAMNERALAAPGDIAVVGFDDILVSRLVRPALSTIGASRTGWGALAATQLIEFLVNGRPFQPSRIPVQLIARESSLKNGRAG